MSCSISLKTILHSPQTWQYLAPFFWVCMSSIRLYQINASQKSYVYWKGKNAIQVSTAAFLGWAQLQASKVIRLYTVVQTKHLSLLSHFLPNKPNTSLGRYVGVFCLLFVVLVFLIYFAKIFLYLFPWQCIFYHRNLSHKGQALISPVKETLF